MEAQRGSEWERGALIGRGAFGSVFLAHSKPSSSSSRLLLPPVFAVKSAEILFSKTIKNEFEVFNNLKVSPYIITCYGDELTLNDEGETVYNLLLEYASGGSLADHINKSIWCRLSVIEVMRYTKQMLLGLAHIHNFGYVHCDIKPDNVLLVPSRDGDFVAKIADFGLTKKVERVGGGNLIKRGTPLYMAPEMVVDGVQDSASDIWAVGCVVYEMLTGYSVWRVDFNETIDDLYHKIASDEPYLAFRLPSKAEAFLRACFVRTPSNRPTAKMLLEHTFLNENCCVNEDVKVIETSWDWVEVKAKDGCEEEEEEDPEEVEEVGNSCEEEEDPEELEEVGNDCDEEEEDPEELQEVGNDCDEVEEDPEELEEVGNDCDEIEEDPEELEEVGNDCEEEEEDPEEQEEVGNDCEEEEEEEDPEEEVGSSCLFEDDCSFVPHEDMTLHPCKRRRISHLNPIITGGDLTHSGH